jgi:hypothetical protein
MIVSDAFVEFGFSSFKKSEFRFIFPSIGNSGKKLGMEISTESLGEPYRNFFHEDSFFSMLKEIRIWFFNALRAKQNNWKGFLILKANRGLSLKARFWKTLNLIFQTGSTFYGDFGFNSQN